jgi:hypothetical protein
MDLREVDCETWTELLSEIWGFHSGEDSSWGLLGCDVMSQPRQGRVQRLVLNIQAPVQHRTSWTVEYLLYNDIVTCMNIMPGIIGTVMPILLHHCTKLTKASTWKKNCVIIKLAPTSTCNQGELAFGSTWFEYLPGKTTWTSGI